MPATGPEQTPKLEVEKAPEGGPGFPKGLVITPEDLAKRAREEAAGKIEKPTEKLRVAKLIEKNDRYFAQLNRQYNLSLTRQQLLEILGVLPGINEATTNENLIDDIGRLQRELGIEDDGIFGPQTLEAFLHYQGGDIKMKGMLASLIGTIAPRGVDVGSLKVALAQREKPKAPEAVAETTSEREKQIKARVEEIHMVSGDWKEAFPWIEKEFGLTNLAKAIPYRLLTDVAIVASITRRALEQEPLQKQMVAHLQEMMALPAYKFWEAVGKQFGLTTDDFRGKNHEFFNDDGQFINEIIWLASRKAATAKPTPVEKKPAFVLRTQPSGLEGNFAKNYEAFRASLTKVGTEILKRIQGTQTLQEGIENKTLFARMILDAFRKANLKPPPEETITPFDVGIPSGANAAEQIQAKLDGYLSTAQNTLLAEQQKQTKTRLAAKGATKR